MCVPKIIVSMAKRFTLIVDATAAVVIKTAETVTLIAGDGEIVSGLWH